jgi:hypothetical protein
MYINICCNKHFSDWTIFVIFLLLGLFGYSCQAVDWFAATPGNLGDARFNSVILEHLYGWTTRSWKNLWSPTFFFPFENVLAFSDNHFGSAWSYIFLRLTGLEREVAFAGWYVIGNILNFVTCFYVLRCLGFSAFSAAAGSFVFSFALPVLFQEGHAQLNYRFAIPLSFLAFWLFLSRRKIASLGAVAFWVAVQFYCSIYLGLFLILLLLGSLPAYLVFNRQEFISDIKENWHEEFAKTKYYFFTVFTVASLSILLLLVKYRFVMADYDFLRSWPEISSMLPRLSSYLLADNSILSSWIGAWVTDIPMRWEHQLFFGIGVWCFALYGIWCIWYKKLNYDLGRMVSISLILLFLVTISIGGLSLYKGLFYIPGLGSIRAISRIVLVMLLPIAILVAVGIENLFLKISPSNIFQRVILAIFIIVLLSGEVLFYKPNNTPILDWHNRQKELHGYLPTTLPSGAVLFVTQNSNEPFYLSELDGMILAQDLNLPTLNGYSGNEPPGYRLPNPCISYVVRLLGYAEFRNIPASFVDEMSKNVIQISPEPCQHSHAETTHDLISNEIAKNINLQILGSVVEKQFIGYVVISNLTKHSFSTVSTKGPIRLSYRFVPIRSPSNDSSKQPGWDSRIDLYSTIAPNESYSEPLSINLPTIPGKYLLEVSMVQEGIAWFHNLGMTVPSQEIIIPLMPQ